MNSCAASCCTCFRKASCAFATSASSPTADALRSCRFAFICSARHRKPSNRWQPPRTIFDFVPSVVGRCGSSKGLLLPRSNFVLPLACLRLPHETTLHHTESLRASARSVSLCLAVLPAASFHFREPSRRENFAPTALSSRSVPAAVLSRTVPAQRGTEPSHH